MMVENFCQGKKQQQQHPIFIKDEIPKNDGNTQPTRL